MPDTPKRTREDFIPFAKRHDALSDPTRVHLLYLICEGERQRNLATVSDLARATGLAAPTVSRHVSLLSHEGYVIAEREGQRIYFSTDMSICEELHAALHEPRPVFKGKPAAQ